MKKLLTLFLLLTLTATTLLGCGDYNDLASKNRFREDTKKQESSQEDIKEPEVSVSVEKPAKLNIKAWTTDRVNFRAAQTTDSEILLSLAPRTEVLLEYDRGEWSEVTVDGKKGFIVSEYLTREEPKGNGKLIVIDPGHSAKVENATEPLGPGSSEMKAKDTSGTSGRASGLNEYELNLQVSLKLKSELEARGYEVILTRTSHDVYLSNIDRASVANDNGADAFIRVHANGSENSSVTGSMTICPSPSNPFNGNIAAQSKDLSTKILDNLVAQTGSNRQYVWETDTMTGLNWSQVPCTIVEMGYMTNPTEDLNMASDAYQAKIVAGIANGVDSFFGF